MGGVEATLVFGRGGWPVQVHHFTRALWWRVVEVIEPETGPPQAGTIDRYVLKVHGPLAYLPGRRGEL